jgi:hypothetical protein
MRRRLSQENDTGAVSLPLAQLKSRQGTRGDAKPALQGVKLGKGSSFREVGGHAATRCFRGWRIR